MATKTDCLPLVLPGAAQTIDSEHSCSALHVVAPCVTKAEQKLASVAARLKQLENDRRSLPGAVSAAAAAAPSDSGSTNGGGTGNIGAVTANTATRRTDHGNESADSVQLEDVLQISGSMIQSMPSSLPNPSKTAAFQSEASGVFRDVTRLLKKLDHMQSVLTKALVSEKAQVQQLKSELRSMERLRLEKLPIIVQKEHDKYFVNLTELEWQATYSERQEIRLDHKLTAARGQLARVTDEFNFFNDYKAVMAQKTEEDTEAIADLQKEDKRISDLLAQHKMELASCQNKLTIDLETAQIERQTISMKLEAARDSLRQINEEVTRINLSHTSNLHAIIMWRETLESNRSDVETLGTQIDEYKQEQDELNEKIASLLVSIRDAHEEQGIEDLRNAKLEEERLKVKRQERDVEEVRGIMLDDIIREQHATTTRLKNMKDEIKRMQEEAAKADKNVEAALKGVERLKGELTRIQEQLEVASEESTRLRAERKKQSVRVDALQSTLRDSEHRLKMDLAQAKQAEQDEEKQQVTIQSRILADQHVLEKMQEVAVKKESKESEFLEGMEVKEKRLEGKVEKLNEEWAHCEETRDHLRTEVEKIDTELHQTQTDLEEQIAPLEPAKEKLQVQVESTDATIQELKWEKDMLEKKIKEFQESDTGIVRLIAKTEDDIEQKAQELLEKQQTIKEEREHEERIRQELTQIKEFRRQAGDKHSSYMKLQHGYLEGYKDEVAEVTEKNKSLSEHYRKSQENSMRAKAELAELLEQRSQLDESIRDHKQLTDWQQRM
eukprot:scpid47139/ scgid8568/ 